MFAVETDPESWNREKFKQFDIFSILTIMQNGNNDNKAFFKKIQKNKRKKMSSSYRKTDCSKIYIF